MPRSPSTHRTLRTPHANAVSSQRESEKRHHARTAVRKWIIWVLLPAGCVHESWHTRARTRMYICIVFVLRQRGDDFGTPYDIFSVNAISEPLGCKCHGNAMVKYDTLLAEPVEFSEMARFGCVFTLLRFVYICNRAVSPTSLAVECVL